MRVRRSWVRRLAIINGNAAFLAPEMEIVPLSRSPPVSIRIGLFRVRLPVTIKWS